MQISKELLKKLMEEIYDKLPKHMKGIDVNDYKLNIHAICMTVEENLFIEIEEVET